MPNKPSTKGDTAAVNDHGLVAVEGRLHPLVWRCRFCDERRTSKNPFYDTDCT